MMHRGIQHEPDPLTAIRKILLAVVVTSLFGTGAELGVIGHYKELLQLVPIGMVVAGLASIGWYGISRTPRALRIFQGIMILWIACGLIGIFVHIAASASDAKKKDNTLIGIRLIHAAVTGTAPPLAPAIMIQIGFIGLAYTYRHPTLSEDPRPPARGCN